MKNIFLGAVLITTTQVFGFSTVVLKTEAKLEKMEILKELGFLASAANGSDYCQLLLRSKDESDSLIVPAGAKFEVSEIQQNGCDYDWGRQCRMDLTSINAESGVILELTCKDRGVFAKELTVSKVNKIAKKIIEVK